MLRIASPAGRLRPATDGRARGLASLVVTGAVLTGALFQTVLATPASAETSATASILPVVTQDVSQLSAFDAELLRLTNVKRAAAGLPALQEARGLTSLSSWWSTEEATGKTAGVLQHNPDGMELVTTSGASDRTVWGENVIKWAPATASPQTIFDAYWSSATHQANLLNKTYRYVGLGTVLGQDGVSWNTMNFTDAADAGQTYDPVTAATPIGHFESATLSGATVRLTGWAIDPDISGGAPVTVTDTAPGGTISTYTTVAVVNRADVAVEYPQAGGAHGFDYSYVTGGRGTHSVCATVVDQGAGYGDVPLGCLSYEVGNPVGAVKSATRSGNTLTISGWAVDPDQPTSAATVTVTDKQPNGTIATTKLVADRADADVATAVPGAGSNHGFTGTVAISGVGDHTVCTSVTATRSTTIVTDLGCKTVTVNPAQPVGAFDSAVAATFDTVTVAGWAVDPDYTAAANSVTVRITNAAGTQTRKITADQAYSVDVAGAGRMHGFAATFPLSSDGKNTVCVSSVSLSDPSVVTELGCKDVTVNWLSGWFDKLTPTTVGTLRTLAVKGWALDRGNLTATATVRIDVTAPNGNVTSTSVLANTARTDIGRAFPGAGDYHGYLNTLTVSAAGSYKVCTTVINPRNVADNKALTCLTATVQ